MALLFTVIFMSKILFVTLKILSMLFSEVKLVWTKCIHWVCPYLFLGLALSSWKSVNFFLMWKALSRPVSKQDTNKTEKAFCHIGCKMNGKSSVHYRYWYRSCLRLIWWFVFGEIKPRLFYCWKRKNATFKTFSVGKQGWRIKGQMLR